MDHFVFDVVLYDLLQRLMMMIVGLVWFLVVVHAEFVSTDDGLCSPSMEYDGLRSTTEEPRREKQTAGNRAK